MTGLRTSTSSHETWDPPQSGKMPPFGERVKQIRELKQLTQKEFAIGIGFPQSRVSETETGQKEPSDALLSAAADLTGFPKGFFYRPPGPDFPLGSLLFRSKRSGSTKRKVAEAHRWAEILYEWASAFASRLDGIRVRVPDVAGEPPVDAAQLARSAFGLSPDRPIPHLIHTLESHGVLVIAAPIPLPGRDAFSTWVPDRERRPLIVIAPAQSGDRVRFSVAHEFAHLAMHPIQRGITSDLEREADAFASEFLMPKEGIRSELAPPIRLESLGDIKVRWGVSIQSLLVRAKQLGVISDRRYQQLFRKLSAAGARLSEPAQFDVPVEKPRALRKMTELLYGTPPDYPAVASELELPLELVAQTLRAHSSETELMTTVPSARTDNIIQFPDRRTPH